MTAPRIAIVGGRTSHQGTGPWLARFFAGHGARITGVLGTREQTAVDAAQDLARRFGIDCRGYAEWSAFLGETRPDLLVIASPANTHREYLERALEAGVPVFCEKPFIWDDDRDNVADAARLIDGFKTARLALVINNQWSESLSEFRKLYPACNLADLRRFEMELSPASTGRSMLIDAMPHAWSMLTTLAGAGRLEDLTVSFTGSDRCAITGAYAHARGRSSLRIALVNHPQQPRPFAYAVNGCRVERLIDPKDYAFKFKTENGVFPIADPMETRVRRALAYLAVEPYGVDSYNDDIVRMTLDMDLLAKTMEASRI